MSNSGGHDAPQTPQAVRVEKNGTVTTIVLARPSAKNAVDRATADQLTAAFRAFDADDTANVAVLYGEGGVFCAGADLAGVAKGPEHANQITPPPEGSGGLTPPEEAGGPLGPTRMLLSKPMIAAVEGHAVAGGLELALQCDLRVADETAIFGVFCRRFGVPLIDGGTVRLPRLIGLSRALDMILTGRPVDAKEAHAMGLANRVVPKGTARAAAEELAAQLAAFPQMTMRADRQSAYESLALPLDEAIANEFKLGFGALMSGEALAGATAFKAGKGRHGSFS